MNTHHMIDRSPTPIEQLARFICALNHYDKIRLAQLVPEFHLIKPKMNSISSDQIELMDFFDSFADDTAESLPDNAIFIQGLTFTNFFTLPEGKQSAIWNKAHIEAENILGDREKVIESNALSA